MTDKPWKKNKDYKKLSPEDQAAVDAHLSKMHEKFAEIISKSLAKTEKIKKSK